MSIPDIRAPFFRQNWVRVKNASGSVIPPHSIVLANGTVSVSDGEPVISVIQPNASSTQFNADGYWITGPDPIGANSSAEGYACDLTTPGFVRYAGSAPSAGTIYGPKHGQLTLEQYYYGFGIVGGATTAAGNNVVVAKKIGIHNILGKADASIANGSSGTVSVWTGAGGSEADTGMNITGVYNQGAGVASGDWVKVFFTGGSYYILNNGLMKGTTAASISKGASGTVNLDGGGSVTASNVIANVGASKVVFVASVGGTTYLIAAECPLT